VPDSRQTQALGKEVLCRVPGSRQTWALGKDYQGQTTSMAVTFAECLPLGTRQRAATWPAQGPPGRLAFAECHVVGTRQRTSLPSASPSTWQKNYFFYFGRQFCCEAFLQYHDQHVQIWHIFSTFYYIFLLYFDLLNFSGKCRFELRVHRIFDLNDSKNDILVFECKVRPNP